MPRRVVLVAVACLPLAACTAAEDGVAEAEDTPAAVDVDVTGSWTGPGTARLDVAEDGTAGGSDGCNALGVELGSVDEPAGRFAVTSSTEMLCPDVPSWDDARSFSVVDGELVIESDDGEQLTTLVRDE